jgi:hypothetical protein
MTIKNGGFGLHSHLKQHLINVDLGVTNGKRI